jgi:FKBP-type peptidyl-prolyl cis-trans isomerase
MRHTGMLTNGKEFDSGKLSFHAGRGEVIAGLDEGVMTMRPGGIRKLMIPPHLGYGGSNAPGPWPPPNKIKKFKN